MASHFFAVDWNKVGANDCDSIFYAPMGGTVILSYYSCAPGCVATGESCRGNEVVIQSNVDTNYAFSVLHLNMVLVPRGRIVKVGDPLGTIGSTGFSATAHAHCVLFKKINRFLTGITIGLQFPDEHAAPFDFSADCGGDGPNNINLDVITGINDLPSVIEKYFRINIAHGNISIKPVNEPFKKYSVGLYNAAGQKLLEQKFDGEGNIKMNSSIMGICVLSITTESNHFIKKIFVR
jgi:murein DD-endopeptidase MepM/ murein hydrolase activator NlpD